MPLPESKRSEEELRELRMRNAFAVRPPVQELKKLALPPVFLGVLYLAVFVAVGLWVAGMFLPALVSAAVVMLFCFIVFWKKPRSRHHMAFIGMISLLVLVFGTVYHVEQLEPINYDAQGSTGY